MGKRLTLPPYAPEPTVTAEAAAGPVLPPYYDNAVMAHGEGWTENPPYFLTAYGLAVREGYGGTLEEWLASLKGETGRSAYDLAVEAGYTGTEEALSEELSQLPSYAVTASNMSVIACAAAGRAEDSADAAAASAAAAAAAAADMVPKTRRINGYDLSQDRSLGASDVGLGNVANERQYSASHPPVKVTTMALTTLWNADGDYYWTYPYVPVTITANSKVDLQPTPAQLAAWMEDGVKALVVENIGGALKVWAVGEHPAAGADIQCTVEETA